MIVEIFVAEWRFGSVTLRDGILFRCQFRAQPRVVRATVGRWVDMSLWPLGHSPGNFKQPWVYVAISSRILVEIVLMIFFGRIEILKLLDLDGYREAVELRFLCDFGESRLLLAGIGVVDACPILSPPVVALTVDRSRVDGHEIELNQ